MKIWKYTLAALLMSAVVLPLSAQDKQYDVKLTVYPKESQVDQKTRKKEEKRREKNFRDEYRDERKVEKSARQAERLNFEPVGIERVQSDTSVVPVSPKESCDPAACPSCGKPECGGCGKDCGKWCDKPCCAEKRCDAPHYAGYGQMPCGMPIFGCNAQYRDFKKMMHGRAVEDFYGSAFYVGTNLLADVLLAPNVSLEFRRDERIAFRLNMGGFYWPWVGDSDNNYDNSGIGGFWVTPEVRWYIGENRSWYAGVMAQYAWAQKVERNEYCLADSGYPDPCFTDTYKERRMAVSLGGSFGYMQRIKSNFAIDYNLSAGVSAVAYGDNIAPAGLDWKCAFSVTNIGVSLVWKACSKPLRPGK